jgi:hypothetical protein
MIEVLRPFRGMPRPSLEALHPRNFRHIRTVKEPDTRDHAARAQGHWSVGPNGIDNPFALFLVPDKLLDFGVELDVLPQVELVGDPVEILQKRSQLGSPALRSRPKGLTFTFSVQPQKGLG